MLIVEGGTHNRLEYREISNAVVCAHPCVPLRRGDAKTDDNKPVDGREGQLSMEDAMQQSGLVTRVSRKMGFHLFAYTTIYTKSITYVQVAQNGANTDFQRLDSSLGQT